MNQTYSIDNKDGICEEKIFSRVYSMNAEYVRNYLYYKCGEMEEADDITQQAFLKMWEKCREVILEKAKSYVFTVANRLFLGKVKREKVALKFLKENAATVDTNTPEAVVITNELRGKIETSISELPEGQREVFLMNRIDKLTYKEISERLGISETAVEKRMSKALLKLRDKIEEFKTYQI